MKIVLWKDVPKLGRQYEVKEVKPGYARNFLIARGLGAVATKSTLAQAEIKRQGRETAMVERQNRLAKEVINLEQVIVRLTRRANELGHLFDGLDVKDLAQALHSQTSFKVEPDWITLSRPIKEVGAYIIPVQHGETKTSFHLVIEPEVKVSRTQKDDT